MRILFNYFFFLIFIWAYYDSLNLCLQKKCLFIFYINAIIKDAAFMIYFIPIEF